MGVSTVAVTSSFIRRLAPFTSDGSPRTPGLTRAVQCGMWHVAATGGLGPQDGIADKLAGRQGRVRLG